MPAKRRKSKQRNATISQEAVDRFHIGLKMLERRAEWTDEERQYFNRECWFILMARLHLPLSHASPLDVDDDTAVEGHQAATIPAAKELRRELIAMNATTSRSEH
ncbi:hypothetical protein [Bradyrhizobium elkanii]|uniref:hypothetical protein n=1 Tax=Bradyrhizobium elkanii TaxID=29448 RepID=UPI003D2234F1